MAQREQVLDRAERLQQAFVKHPPESKHGTSSASILQRSGCEGRSAPSLYCWYVWMGSLIHWSYRTHLPLI